jgi:hypothetical protein
MWLPRYHWCSGTHAEEGRQVLEGMYANDCTSIEESRIAGGSGKAGSQISEAGVRSRPGALFRRTLGSYQSDYYTSASHEYLQGVKDPRLPVLTHAMLKLGPRRSQPLLGGLTK